MSTKRGVDTEWSAALFGGTLITLGLFAMLQSIGRPSGTEPPVIISVDFLPQSAPQTAPPAAKPKPPPTPPVPKAPSKPAAEPKPKSEPAPKTPEKPSDIPDEVAEKIAPPPQPETKPVEAALPTPTPIFELTAMPRFIQRLQPEYPPAMKQQGREGTVKLAVLVDAGGQVRRVTVVQSAGEDFDQAAIAAIQLSSFAPGEVDGKAVPVLMKIPVTFKLR